MRNNIIVALTAGLVGFFFAGVLSVVLYLSSDNKIQRLSTKIMAKSFDHSDRVTPKIKTYLDTPLSLSSNSLTVSLQEKEMAQVYIRVQKAGHYILEAEAGLDNFSLDPVMHLYELGGNTAYTITSDDDGGTGFGARIVEYLESEKKFVSEGFRDGGYFVNLEEVYGRPAEFTVGIRESAIPPLMNSDNVVIHEEGS